jgi:hypothetical protein
MQTDVDGYRVGLNQSLEGETWGKGNGWVYICGAPHGGSMGAWSGRRDMGLEAEGPFLCSATVTGIVSDDEKTETRTGPPGRRRNQSATPIPGRRCADGQTARQPDSRTARQLADPPAGQPVSHPCVALRGFSSASTGGRLCWARWALTRTEAVGGHLKARGHRDPSEPPAIRASLL